MGDEENLFCFSIFTNDFSKHSLYDESFDERFQIEVDRRERREHRENRFQNDDDKFVSSTSVNEQQKYNLKFKNKTFQNSFYQIENNFEKHFVSNR